MTDTPKPRLLFLAHILPYPLDGGAKIKSYHTLKLLAQEYEVTLVSFIRSEGERRYLADLRELCVGGVEAVVIHRSKVKNVLDAAKFWAVRTPFIVGRDRVPAMVRTVRERMGARRFDAVHIDHLQMAQYVLPRRSPVKLILDHHNVESQIIERLAQTSPSKPMRAYANREWPKLQKYELDVCRQVDRVLVVSNEDAALLRRLASDLKNITVVPIGVDGDRYQPVPRFADPKTLLSIGTMYWPPNVDGMLRFYSTVYPLIKEQVADVHLKIVGADPVEKILRMGQEDKSVEVTGYVEDDRTSASDCAVYIVPLRAGGGMRVKILNAMAMALPVVSTTVGAEGLAAATNKNILIADSSEAFARECVKLLKDPARGNELGDAGRKLVEDLYLWDAVGKALLSIYEYVLKQPARLPETGEKEKGKVIVSFVSEPYNQQVTVWPKQGRHILAQFDDETILVYQAYHPSIGQFAAENKFLGGGFSYSRMSWVKPNFLWMMSRSGWGTKENQQITLGLRLRRQFFDFLLAQAVPSSWDREQFVNEADWKHSVGKSCVRLQWDPDHHPSGAKLDRRAIQLGLRGDVLEAFGRHELIEVLDLSEFVAEQPARLISKGVSALVTPRERVYRPSDPEIAQQLRLAE